MIVRPVVWLTPGSIEARTGGSIYNRRMIAGLRERGWPVQVVEAAASFPHPSADDRRPVARALAGAPAGGVVVVDSLIAGAAPDEIAAAPDDVAVVALMHLPLAADPALSAEETAVVAAQEARALARADLVVATGTTGAALLARYDLSPHRLAVVAPGTDAASLALGSHDGVVHLLAVGTINPVKRHEWLLETLAPLADLAWRLTCAGSLERDAATAARVHETIARLDLGARVTLAGDLDRDALERCYARADVFVSASRVETYGMAVAEALAHGLPVVMTNSGDLAAPVAGGAGLVVAVEDAEALRHALRRVIEDEALRARLAEGARAAAAALPSWPEAAARLATALEGVRRHG